MGQLKPSEVRLLIIFCIVVLGLATFFGYELYAKKLALVAAQKSQFEGDRNHLQSLKSQQTEFNEKLVWMNQNQPLARDEFAAKDALDRVVSVEGISAAGLTLVNAPPEKEPSRQEYYWAFERRVVVQGTLQNIVQWLAQLQSETSFRAITQLHVYPKKKKEPETLTCEVTVEQRYATDEVIEMTTPGVAMASLAPTTTSTPGAASSAPTGSKGPADPPNLPVVRAPTTTSKPAETGDDVPKTSRRVVVPGAGENAKPVRPKIKLPNPTPPSGASVAPQSNGLLANAKRSRTFAAKPPPAMQADLDAAKQFAYDNDTEVQPVRTAVVLPDAPTTAPAQPVYQGNGTVPSAPNEVNPPEVGVGEGWSASTPGVARNLDSQPKPTAPEAPQFP